MKDLSIDKFFFFAATAATIFAAIFAAASFKLQVSLLPKSPARTGYNTFAWLAIMAFAASLFAAGLAVRPSTRAGEETNKPHQNSNSRQKEAKIDRRPAPVVVGSPLPRPETSPNNTVSVAGTPIVAYNINKFYSRNALMGGFTGALRREGDEIIFSFPNPVIYLAGDSERKGDREIFSVEVAVDDRDELAKIARTSKMRGKAYWSKPVELKGVVRHNGQEDTINQPVEISVPIPSNTNLANKAFLIKMHNRFVGSSAEIFPGYVLSANNVFSRN